MDVSGRTNAVICMAPDCAAAVLPPDLRERLAQAVDPAPDLSPALLTALTSQHAGHEARGAASVLAQAELLITGWGCPPLTEQVLAAAPGLRAVIHAAGSVKGHLPPAVWERGITVSSAAEANAGPVADFTCATIALAAKQAVPAAARYAAGWPDFTAREGADSRTVGIIGASRIGRRVIATLTASEAGYTVLLSDPYVTAEQAATLGAELLPLDELCRRSSIVSVHAPELPETRNLLDARRLALLPDGATVINTARGTLIDTDALTRACATGRLNAFLDVTHPEPLPPDHPLLGLRNVLVTPHIAGAQGSEVRRLGAYAIAETERFVRGEPLHGLVTATDLSRIA
ncbi:hydroxyacid dehydrogenase [Streptomyces sp. NPDC047108]|uniref:hydroxyacid dehydrogenase n=1 Tax=Streptomyces sp. NPDC047108 TaxID=3155025 RepID=UPI0033F5C5E4